MALFTVRVELHGATEAHYELLHQSMAMHGFKRFVSGTDTSGRAGTWALPTAEYDYERDASAEEVRDQVRAIANVIKFGAWVLVTKVAERSWSTARVTTL